MSKILVVDDEKMIASALQRVLVKAAHAVSVAANGIEAVALLEKESFDLVFLDLLMPEMNGTELIDWIRVHKPNARFVVMTAYGDQSSKEQLLQLGAIQVLAKPFENILEIPKLIEKILSN